MDRGGNNNNKGKEQMVEEDQAGAGDGNNANPSNIVDTSGTNLGLSLELAPKGPPEEELSGAGGVIRRMRGLGAEGSSTGRRRMHKCKYCEKEFSTSQALGGHQNAHKPERAATKFQESLGKMGAMERDQMNMNRYQPYMFNPSRNVLGTLNIGGRPASGLASGVPPTRQQPIFQSHLSSFLSAGLGSGNRFPAPGQVPPPVVLPRQGGNEPAGSQGFSQAFRSWSEFLARPRNTATSGEGSSNIPIARSSGVPSTSGMGGDGRRLMYYPGGIGFGPQGLIGNNPNANVNQNLDLFGHNLHPNANLFGSVDHPAGNVNPDNNVGAGIGAAAAPPAEDNADGENENEGQEELDLTLRL